MNYTLETIARKLKRENFEEVIEVRGEGGFIKIPTSLIPEIDRNTLINRKRDYAELRIVEKEPQNTNLKIYGVYQRKE